MNISKVKLVDSGLKGLEVEYLKPEGKESHKWLNEYKVKYKTPANAELRVAIDEMKKHLINICMFDKDINDLDIEIVGLACNGRQFLLSGKVRTLENSYFAINTPLVKEDSGYGLFAECIKQIDVIYEWVSKYVELGAKVDYEKVAEELRSKGKLDLEGKTAEEIKAEAMNILEEMGCVILEQIGDDILDAMPIEVRATAVTEIKIEDTVSVESVNIVDEAVEVLFEEPLVEKKVKKVAKVTNPSGTGTGNAPVLLTPQESNIPAMEDDIFGELGELTLE